MPIVAQQNQIRAAMSPGVSLRMLPRVNIGGGIIKLTHSAQSPGRKQWRNPLLGEFVHLPFQNLAGRKLSIRELGLLATDLIKDFFRQPRLTLVLVGNTMNGRNGFRLSASRKEVFGRFVEVEEEKSTDEHEES